MKKIYFLLLFAFATNCIQAQTTRTVANYSEFVSALGSSAVSGDIISLSNDIVVTAEVIISKTVTINGNGYLLSVPNPGMLDQGQFNNNSPSSFRVFSIDANSNVKINNCTIKGGFVAADNGACIKITAATSQLHLTNVTISHGRAGNIYGTSWSGGAIYINYGQLYMNNCAVMLNAATFGGAISNFRGTVSINETTIAKNRSISPSGGGGAISNWSGKMYLNNSTIANNQGTEIGGAIINYSSLAYLYLVNCTLTGNVTYGSSSFKGGAVGQNSIDGKVYAINSVFAYNYHISAGTVSSPTAYELDDIVAYSGQNLFYLYYCVFHAPLPTGTNNVVGNFRYNGAADGSDNTIFSGGLLAPVTSNTGNEIGTAKLFRPYLLAVNGLQMPTLKTTSILLDDANSGTQTRFNNTSGAVVAYYNKGTFTWTNLTGTSAANQLVTTDQGGVTRRPTPLMGATETTFDNLFMVKVLSSANGTVNGGSLYGDIYSANQVVTLTAIPNAGYAFDKWSFVSGGNGTSPTNNPYSFGVAGNVTLEPLFVAVPNGTYTITYVGNGSTRGTVPASQRTTTNALIPGKGNLSKAGFAFAGWNTSANGSGTAYAASNMYTAGTNVVLYAQWKRNYWIGATNTSAAVASNWEATQVPTSNEDWVFSPASQNNLVLDNNYAVNTINFNGSANKVLLGNYDLMANQVLGANSTNYVQTNGTGIFKMYIAAGGAKLWAVGNSAYNPVTISNNNIVADEVGVAVADEVYENGTSGTIYYYGRVKRTWRLTRQATVNGLALQFNWNTNETENLTTPALYANEDGTWQKQTGATTFTSNSLTYTGYEGTGGWLAVMENSIVLPVTWLGVAVEKQSGQSLLSWNVTNEAQVKNYVVQHGTDNQHWTTIATVNAATNPLAAQRYRFVHSRPAKGNNYYRIWQQDKQGSGNFSKIVSLNFEATTKGITVYPNPATNGQITLSLTQPATVRLINSAGVTVYSGKLPAGNKQFNWSRFAKGMYWLYAGEEVIAIQL